MFWCADEDRLELARFAPKAWKNIRRFYLLNIVLIYVNI